MSVLFFVNHVLQEHSGVKRKILEQVSAIKKITGKNVYLSFLATEPKRNFRVVDEFEIDAFYKFIPPQIFAALFYSKILKFIKDKNIKTIYIRYTQFSNCFFINFLKKLNQLGIYVVLEIPTYPYDLESKNARVLKKIQVYFEKTTRLEMINSVSDIVTFTNEGMILGKKPISISNAAPSLTDIDLKYLKKPKPKGVINLLCVARLEWWHGYDRIIKSLNSYAGKPLIHIHIVGDGPELSNLKKLVEIYNLSGQVTFHGSKSGGDLSKIKGLAHIGIDSLGRYRSGNSSNSSLKSKEYLCFGLPIVHAHNDFSLRGFEEFCFQVSNDDALIDLSSIVDWYVNKSFDTMKISKSAIAEFNWVKQLSQVFKY